MVYASFFAENVLAKNKLHSSFAILGCKMNREIDSSISSKAAGFLIHLESFEFYFQLTMIVEVLEKIEILNKELQKSNFCALDSHRKVDAIMISLEAMRDSKFELILKKCEERVKTIGLEEPKLKCSRTVSKHIDPNCNTAHAFKTPKEYYSRMFVLRNVRPCFDVFKRTF